jgi:hypothetical protein
MCRWSPRRAPCALAALLARSVVVAVCAFPVTAFAETPGAPAVKGGPGELPRAHADGDAGKDLAGRTKPVMPIEPAPKHGSMKLGAKPSGAKLGVPPTGEGPIGSPPTHASDEGGPPRPH